MISQNSIEALKSSLDIVDVIGNYLELKKAGANFKANCPFHGEKTPSFVVSPSKQIFHCFGCGVGGDSIKFVMELEKLNYPEAIEKLASSYNFSLEYTKGGGDFGESKRILEAVQKFYIKNLDLNDYAKKYLQDRGVYSSSIEEFGLGFVGNSKSVLNFLNSSMLPLPKAQDVGIVAIGDNGSTYARLVDRITFPIYSSNANLIGFGGRTITNHPAKYINSPQTKLFNKSRVLYGYHRAKDKIYRDKRIIICEGYLDVIMFHQAGFKESVATLGTALTNEHIPLLRKGEPEVILAYDGDKAGVEAGFRASLMLSSSGFDGGIVLFKDGLDPADMIANGKADEVAKILRKPKKFISFVIEKISQKYDINNPIEKEKAFNDINKFLHTLSPIVREAYLPQVASMLSISSNIIANQISKEEPTQTKVYKNSREDITELSIIKTLIQTPSLIDNLVDTISTNLFIFHKNLLDIVLKGELDNSKLMGLLIDEELEVMSEDELQKSLINLKLRECQQQIISIGKDSSIDYKKKSFLIRKLRVDIIPRLKKGELI
ncbi:DNA primase [hydrothermal vent metagenome]|uniref:DNA primase n=1 Tax=hydrothermal vent metagenome TaxID=652676 RepID=A0A1W1EJS4_9ZZZZ